MEAAAGKKLSSPTVVTYSTTGPQVKRGSCLPCVAFVKFEHSST